MQLYDYLKPLPAPPETWDVSGLPKSPWGMLANDSEGDCTCASACHMQMVYDARIGLPNLVYTDDQCLNLYGRVNGGHDDGAVELFVLREWQKHGITGDHDKLFAYTSVNRANHQLVRQANWLFDGLYLGVALPLAVQGLDHWDVVGDWQADPISQPGSWGGHAINSVSYDKDSIRFVSWGRVMSMTWKFWDVYCEEAYALLPMDWHKQPNAQAIHDGLKVKELEADIKRIKGQGA